MTKAIATEFKAPFHEADKLYAKDSNPENPNTAPKDCWPSAREFRNILFKVGQRLGSRAEKYLDRIPDPICGYLPKSNFAPALKICRSSAAFPPFARRKHRRNGVFRLRSLKTSLVPNCRAFAVRNANGSRARNSSGRASAGIGEIHSKLADYALDARINGKSPDVSSVEQCLRIANGTWTIEQQVHPAIRLRKQTSVTASGYMVGDAEVGPDRFTEYGIRQNSKLPLDVRQVTLGYRTDF